MWAVLSATDRELHQPTLTSAALSRLQRSLEVTRTELERSVSAPLAAELCGLLPPQATRPGMDELRVECASLLGWTSGVAEGILEQLEATAAAIALPRSAGLPPGSSPSATA